MKYLKASKPIEFAGYAVANSIEDGPEFKWWVKDVLCKRDQIISRVKSKYWRTTHKFGIQVSKMVDEAYKIDQKTGTNFWTKAVEKEMDNVRVIFKDLKRVTPENMR